MAGKNILVLGGMLLLLFGCAEQIVEPGAIAVWQQRNGGDWDIRYSLWYDNARIWYTPEGSATALIADLEGDDHDPYVDSDGRGAAIAVWSNAQPGFSHIYYSIWKERWSPPAAVATPAGYSMDPAVAMMDEGSAVAVWVQKDTAGTTKLYYSVFSGSRWSAPAEVSGHMRVSMPELKFSPGTGAYFLIWTENNGTSTRVYSSIYKGGEWAAPVQIPGQAENAVLDNNVPTDERLGLAAAKNKAEAYAVWPTTNGAVYYSKWAGAGWSNAARLSDGGMPDADYDAAGAPYTVFIKQNTLWSNLRSLSMIPGTGADRRPAFAFLNEGMSALALFWTTASAPSDIFFTRWDGMLWEAARVIEVVPGEDRNPDVSPLLRVFEIYEDFNFTFCGDGAVQRPNDFGQLEECEAGVACPNPDEWCDLDTCLCEKIVTPNVTWCGDGVIQRPNTFGQVEQCEQDADCAQGQKCVGCECTVETVPGGTHMECSGERCIRVQGTGEDECTSDEQCREPEQLCGNAVREGSEQCDIGGGAKPDGSRYPAGRDTCTAGQSCRSDCTCKPGVVTPRCGDGYISHMFTGGGGSEECDLGGRYGGPVLPDTCPPPTTCSEITCRCEAPPQVEDGMHYGCAEGGCILMEGEGPNECLFNSQCRHSECGQGTCIEVMTPGTSECDMDSDCRHTECSGDMCVEVLEPGRDECNTDADCTHSECREGTCEQVSGPGSDECDADSDCRHYGCVGESCELLYEPGTSECEADADCVVAYCGNGRVDAGEECDGQAGCDSGGVCSEGCTCVYPPSLSCGSICGETPGAEVVAQGLSSSQECSSRVTGYYDTPVCYTTCRYSWFYRVDNIAGYDSCCCGMVKRFPCTDCPGQNPQCPPESTCAENAPSWYSP
ncbi:MAG: hypothetical protein AB1657_00975 [Candidatus Micrarchaeota archaeon]